MAISRIKAAFQSDIQRVWDVVTSLENYSWRSDLGKIEIKNEKQFLEYTKEGYVTAKKIYMKPFVKAYLKKQQELYISDLKKALS